MTIQIIESDCMDALKSLESDSVDLIVTDPPYGIDYKSNRQGIDRKRSNAREGDVIIRESYFTTIANDNTLPTEWLSEAQRVLKDGSAIYIFCHWTKWHLLYPAVAPLFTIKNMIVLNKSNHGMGDLNGQYAPKHELLLYAVKGRHLLDRSTGRRKDVWDVPIRFTGAHRLHPNEKPLSWLRPCVESSSKAGDLVLDPFSGSGSLGEVCRELSRNCMLIDVSSEYCDVMRKRLNIPST